ncbi:MAG: ABC-2 transporter permease [Clostridiaceae bacterium]|nr:ABC-2 transporter permease [Clostridiaceae bacterium]
MFNLVVKDILIQKKRVLFALLYIIFMVIAFQNMGLVMFTVGVTACTYMLIMTACAYEDMNKSDIMMNSLPVKKSQIVAAKYLSVFVFFIMGTLAYAAFYGVVKLTGIPLGISPVNMTNLISGITSVCFISGIYLPIFFKVGYVKSKIINFVLFFSVFFGASYLVTILQESMSIPWLNAIIEFVSDRGETFTAIVFLALILVFMFISYLIALRLYKHREF